MTQVKFKDNQRCADIAKKIGSRRRSGTIHTVRGPDFTVEPTGREWSGGSRWVWYVVNCNNQVMQIHEATQIPEGGAIVSCGTFCGKPSYPGFWIRECDSNKWGI